MVKKNKGSMGLKKRKRRKIMKVEIEMEAAIKNATGYLMANHLRLPFKEYRRGVRNLLTEERGQLSKKIIIEAAKYLACTICISLKKSDFTEYKSIAYLNFEMYFIILEQGALENIFESDTSAELVEELTNWLNDKRDFILKLAEQLNDNSRLSDKQIKKTLECSDLVLHIPSKRRRVFA